VFDAVEKKVRIRLARLTDRDPQIVGALGAALIAADFSEGKTIAL